MRRLVHTHLSQFIHIIHDSTSRMLNLFVNALRLKTNLLVTKKHSFITLKLYFYGSFCSILFVYTCKLPYIKSGQMLETVVATLVIVTLLSL